MAIGVFAAGCPLRVRRMRLGGVLVIPTALVAGVTPSVAPAGQLGGGDRRSSPSRPASITPTAVSAFLGSYGRPGEARNRHNNRRHQRTGPRRRVHLRGGRIGRLLHPAPIRLGTTVTITGNDLMGAAHVLFGALPAASFDPELA